MAVTFRKSRPNGDKKTVTVAVDRNELIKQWDPWLFRVSKSYANGMGARLSADDLFQECRLVLYNVSQRHHPHTQDFPKVLKTEVIHRCIDCVRLHRTKGRDLAKEVDSTTLVESGERVDVVDTVRQIRYHGQEEWLTAKEMLTQLRDRLSDPAKMLLRLLIHPTPELRTLYQAYRTRRMYPRSTVPNICYARALGTKKSEVAGLFAEIRKAVNDNTNPQIQA